MSAENAFKHPTVDLAVVGGGIIGLAVAWRARKLGLSVTLLERDELCGGATNVAAGMLAPVAEAEFGAVAARQLALGLESALLWPSFASDLEQASGIAVGLRKSGTMIVARDADEARELERQIALRDSLGLDTRRLRPSEARALEPALAPTLRLALEAPKDHSVDPRLVASALARACKHEGVALREHKEVTSLSIDEHGERVCGVILSDGEVVPAAQTLFAAGAWSGSLDALPAAAQVPVRPVKGQILRLRDPAGPGLLERVLRFEGGYVVPRGDGRYVLGATVEEQGFNLHPTAGGVYELLREAIEILPGLRELEIDELSVGLRPGSPDNAPIVGCSSLEGLLWATGHHRNGILLAPLTAELLCAMLAGDDSRLPSAWDPGRFATGLADVTADPSGSPIGTHP